MKKRPLWPGIALGLLIPGIIYGANAIVPNRFQSGGLIRADEMNANFDSLRDAINAGQSGSRLHVIRMLSPDGLSAVYSIPSQFPLLWDSQLSITCLPYRGRCGPMHSTGYFSDPACQQSVALAGADVYQIPAVVALMGFDAGVAAEVKFAYEMTPSSITYLRVGAAQTGDVYARQVYSDGGFLCSPQGSQAYYPVTGTEPASTFAPLSMTVN